MKHRLILFHVYIVNRGSVFNFWTLRVVCLLDDHKAARFIYDTKIYPDTGNLQTIWLLKNIRITYYQQIFGKHFFFFFCGTRASQCCGLSHYGAQAPDAQAQRPWLTGPAAPRHVASSRTGTRTCVPCIGRRTPYHCATKEALEGRFLTTVTPGKPILCILYCGKESVLEDTKEKHMIPDPWKLIISLRRGSCPLLLTHQ